ncbi:MULTISPECIES: DUF2905 domain-containing protein [Bacillus]|jgi:predicted tellurium resistance membrane protein TerC|uniref:DUF2905 domain-containing protein n=1 Tax=Bacillus mojavensis TaxID=72360 RepID=A0AAP3CQ60_BACMO|nr:DUF2905 domain-containing protein [Bacillus mojavensis]MCY7782566.1 DUF2905 domain-containing protein [Bacillus sp. S20C3]MCY8204130.1 DUF2905 domain-containing protein [Bacillus sp. N12A5]MCY8286826.1 DUF2905 domain-containing protein [Bacillus sp. N13C7]MCY8637379.1 DUF2905 domain-containing protein [Bacillus sp. S17B2]MCY8718056.1 DUF2905 domain-containing protein [Bacillus sp. S10C12M]MCY9143557.1 DUF2905 domain-containing protein [Bacillus sp. T9C1]
MTEFPKIIMILGAVLLIIGAILHFVGKMPGDIFVKKGNVTFFFPVVTCIIISVVLSILLNLFGRMK